MPFPKNATSPPRRSRPRPSRSSLPAATSSASPRPAPARPRPSRCRSSSTSPPPGCRPQPKSCRVLVLSPTRELAGQILDSFRTYGRHLRSEHGARHRRRADGPAGARAARGVDVLVATPGRLLDLVQSQCRCGSTASRSSCSTKPTACSTWASSTTSGRSSPSCRRSGRRCCSRPPCRPRSPNSPGRCSRTRRGSRSRRPQRPSSASSSASFTSIAPTRPALLVDLLRSEAGRARAGLHPHQARRRQGGARPGKGGIAAEAIHGNKSQNQRERVLGELPRRPACGVLVATDIAARGIDVDGISHVINFDLPNIPESYVHRIGRTARAGADGIAISLCSHDETAVSARHRKADPDGDPVERTGLAASEPAATSCAMNADATSPQRTWTAAAAMATMRKRQSAKHARPRQATPAAAARPAARKVRVPDRGDFAKVAFMQPR